MSATAPRQREEIPSSVLLTPDQVAARWSVPRATVYRLTRADKLPVVRLGKHYRYRLEAIEEFERDGGTT